MDKPVVRQMLEARRTFIERTGEKPKCMYLPPSAAKQLKKWAEAYGFDPFLSRDKKAIMRTLSEHIFGMDVIVRDGEIEAA